MKRTLCATAVAMAFASRLALAQPPLAAGTLPQLKPGGTLINANVGAPVAIPGGMQLNINQTKDIAKIDWSSFNIANGSMVNFLQPSAQSSVLNTIFQGVPSIIQGKINANGIVYLINQNGIIFDRGSQVNVGGLVASALGLNTVSTGQTFFDGGTVAVGTNPAFSGYGTGPDGKPAQIQLLGTINATGPSAQGTVMVFAPKIVNQGTINAPDGQVILAAGQKVWLFNNSDTTMRGFVVEYAADPNVGPSGYADASSVTNLGQVLADRGNVTLGGLAINQAGVASASTAAVLNGSVWLIAREGGSNTGSGPRNGSVTLAPGSVTQTPLDTTDTTTLSQGTPYTPANIHIEGQSIVVQGSVLSPGGNISLIAADPQNTSSTTTSRIFVDNGATISAAGDWVSEPASANLLTIQVTSNQLADAPLQRGGVLQGQNVVVDINKGTPLFDISPFVSNVQRTVAEKAEVGGSVSFNSQGDVVLRPGSVVDVSGGGANIAGGQLATTKLVSNGVVVDIGQASPNLHYDAVLDTFSVNYPRWNVTETFSLASLGGTQSVPADVVGQAAGSISVIARGGAALEGNLLASVVAGRNQQASGKLPAGGAFILGDSSTLTTTKNFAQGSVIIGPSFELGPDFTASTPLPPQLAGTVYLPESFFKTSDFSADRYTQQGFGSVSVFANDSISLPAGQSVVMPAGGAISLTSRNVDIEGSINAPAGSISLTAVGTSVGGGTPLVNVGSQSMLLARGQWINQTSAGGAAAAQAGVPAQAVGSVNGGTITISGGGLTSDTADATLQAGSVLDVSGGGLLAANGSLTKGSGGTISLSATDHLDLSGTLEAFALGSGGTLKVTAPSVRIGEQASGTAGELLFTPDRFAQGGFSRFSLSGLTGLSLDAGTSIEPKSQTLVIDLAAARFQPTGADLSSFATPTLLPAFQRKPASLSLASTGGDLHIETGSSIVLDPQASLSLSAKGTLEVAGSLAAPAGNVSLTVNGNTFTSPGRILIDSGAVLSAQGVFVPSPSTTPGQVNGSMLGGGSIALTANNASITVQPGALLDVSGAGGVISIPAGTGAAAALTQVTSDAGSITMSATHSSRIEGTLRGQAQGQSAGGAFEFDFAKGLPVDPTDTAPRRIIVGQSAPAQGSTPLQGSLAGGVAPFDAYLGLGDLAAQGIDKVQLHAEEQIQFAGNMSVAMGRSARLDAPEFVATPGSHVSFSAPQVAFGGTLVGTTAPAAPAPGSLPPGTASLSLSTGGASSGLIELFGYTRLPGFANVELSSVGDIRMSGLLSDVTTAGTGAIAGSFWTSGNVTLQAAQVYPTTFTSFTLGVDSPTGSITVAPAAGTQEPVYSAGGSLTFQASTIEQGGVVKAPLGQLTFNASNRVDLLPGSTTSASAEGLTIPYGGTQGGVTWNFDGIAVSAPPAKNITLSAPNVAVAAGAKADLSGGGDILGVEWISGPGGSKDFLAQPGVFAVIPGIGFTPSDAHIASNQPLGFSSVSNVYDSVTLSGGAGLPAGTYALLPGYYALLPGAYVVRAQPGFTDIQPGQIAGLANGLSVISGYRTVAGTGIRESRTSGFIVQPGADALQQAEYSLSNSSFFSNQAQASGAATPALPRDAGSLVLNASSTLQLNGTFAFDPAPGGASGRLDITAANIAIVDSPSQAGIPGGFLALSADELTATKARLLIGASTDSIGTNLNVAAGNILVANDDAAPVSVPELILAATGSINVNPGSVLVGTGAYAGPTSDLSTAGPGAMLRVASGTPLSLSRTGNPLAGGGTLNVAAGAVVHGDRAVLLDATESNILAGKVTVGTNGALDIGAPRISLGETAGVTNGLVLSGDQLAAVGSVSSLVLRSYSSIDLYGTANLGDATLASLTLRSGGLAGYAVGGANAATLSAETIQIDNIIGGVFSGNPTGTGTLSINAKQVTVGAGSQQIRGFGDVAILASESFIGSGTGSLAVAGNLGITASRITGTTGSNQSISGLAVSLAQPASPSLPADVPSPGAQLAITGTTLTDNARIDLPSGKLALTATGGDLVLGDGAVVNASGFSKSFGDVIVSAPAGSVSLTSTSGAVTLRPGSTVDVSAPLGGDAGTVSISAIAGTLDLQGTLLGNASSGNTGGTFLADANSLSNFSGLVANAAVGGFTGAQSFRARTGDITVGPADTVAASQVTLVADRGSITLNGTIDASGKAGGGRVELDAGNTLSLAAGSRILANATSPGTSPTDPYANGGLVRLSSTSQGPGVTLSFDPGASIDVSAGGKGDAGRVEFTTTRTPVANASLRGKVVGAAGAGGTAGQVIVYANNVTDVTGADPIAAGNADYASFMGTPTAPSSTYRNARDTFRASLQAIGFDPTQNVNVRPAVELRSTGNLTLSSPWDLTQASLLVDGQPGLLTLRAAGTLDIRAALGLPNPATPATTTALFANEAIPAGPTWSIQLVGGADLASANRMALQPLSALTNGGDVTLTVVPNGTARSGQLVRVRTGTGDIEVAAGRNFAFIDGSTVTDTTSNPQHSRDLINESRAAIYTTGTLTPTDSGSRFLQHGGEVRIYAQGDADGLNLDSVKMSGWSTTGADSVFNQINQPFIGDWLRRTTLATSRDASGWWVDRRLFSGEIGSFGGGDVSIVAGGKVDHLSAMNASSGQVGGVVNARTLTVQGGGALDVQAGGNILGGDYLVSNNSGTVSAGGSIGVGARTGFFLIGESTDPARAGASIAVEATGDIRVQNLSNPTILSSSLQATQISSATGLFAGSGTTVNTDGFGATRDSFFSYSPSDQASLLSTAGNIDLDGSARADSTTGLPRAVQNNSFNQSFNVAPPRLDVIALSGNVTDTRLNQQGPPLTPDLHEQRLFPSSQQFLRVLAGGDISNLRFEAEDAVRSTLPSWSRPVTVQNDQAPDTTNTDPNLGLKLGAGAALRNVTPSANPGYAYNVMADGSLYDLQLSLPGASTVRAGLDIDTVRLDLQNLQSSDVSVVSAGRDIVYRKIYRSGLAADPDGITITGVGRLLVQAGRNIDLGVSSGIQATGNVDSTHLPNAQLPSGPQTSAALTVIAGYSGPVSFDGIDNLFAALDAAGKAHDAAAGDAAVSALFLPQFVSQVGNINMFHSTINTGAGSGIDLLVPSGAPGSALGGNINAGLPVPPTSDKQIGILTTGYFGGGIRAFTQNDFSVNQSKVITQQGGDIFAYTSNGSIDAGRGSKAALTVTGPIVPTTLPDGSVVVKLPGVGSGIQTATYDPDGSGPKSAPKPGDVSLFAVRGTINAGEAGINSAGGITVFALQILNAQNITAQGPTSGLPIAQVGSIAASLAGASNAGASAAQSATEQLRSNQNPGFGVSNISVEVICMGESPCTASD